MEDDALFNETESIGHPPHILSLSSLHPLSLSILFTASSHHLFYKELRGRFCWLRSKLTSHLILSWRPALMSNQRARKERRWRRRARASHLRQQTMTVSYGRYHWYHGEQTLVTTCASQCICHF